VKALSPTALKWTSLLTASAVGGWMGTLDYKAAFYEPDIDPAVDRRNRRIWVFWHEYILIPLFIRGHCNLSMLLSQHRDADILARVGKQFGFECVRGSTFAGGTSALLALGQRARETNLTITPDGPRGPRRRLAQGCVFLASTLGLPVVAMGLGYDRPWRAKSWDRFAIPRPFSRARGVIGPEMRIPPNLNRAGIERYRLQVERVLNLMTSEAEAWAESGQAKLEQQPIRRGPSPLGIDEETLRVDAGHTPVGQWRSLGAALRA